MNYNPSLTAQRFLAARSFGKLIMGPVGGGKSTVCIMSLWSMACHQEPWKNVRRTKYIILRNTMAQLKSTVKPLIDQWFVEIPSRPLGVWRVVDNTFEIRCRLPDGTVLHTEFVLMAADNPDDVRRLLSIECSSAWVEEAREVDEAVFNGLQGRVARYPNRASGGVTYPCVICSTNAPPVGTYWHELISNPPKNFTIHIQPPALLPDGSLNPEAENIENLDANYYANLVEGKTDDWIGVYLKNKFGAGGFGQPVFKGTFRNDFHVSKLALKPVFSATHPLIVGADNGLTAAAVIGQQNALGKVCLIDEAFVPDHTTMGWDKFLDLLLKPKLVALNVPSRHILFVVDPACFQRSQANEVTIAMVIQKAGYQVVRASTNNAERRVSACEQLLMQQVDGQGKLQISPTMTHTIAALEWGYRNKKQTAAGGAATIDKNFHSHVGDAFEYFCLHFAGASGGYMGTPMREVEGARFAYT